jgi:dCMP deaminase
MTTQAEYDAHWIRVAYDVSRNADCRRRKIGAVLVSVLGRQLGTGANAVLSGKSCTSGGCPRGLLSLEDLPAYADYRSGPGICHATHAEHRAIQAASLVTTDITGSTLYCTDKPCDDCSRLVFTAGIARVVTPEGGRLVQVPGSPEDDPTGAVRYWAE